jgi:hypothetical protein
MKLEMFKIVVKSTLFIYNMTNQDLNSDALHIRLPMVKVTMETKTYI